ncbi:hypothetical protein QJQ45_019621 [Haematococcus lacustris]|nr:hypothetical protein QJQ45_019621 [Haematococcus lacustris]
MPPKVKADKEKQKKVEDKTFGLKNKNKSKAVQNYVKQVTSSSESNSSKAARIAAQQGIVNPKDKKKAEEERQKELAALFAVAIKQPKVPPGVDPKSMVCEFFRHGQCTKGFKCKFAHDLEVEKKAAKISLFSDKRDEVAEDDEEGMDDWDQETLERVVKEKHGAEKPSNATTIICKFFLEAVEKHQYGWFWKCPNGVDCKYRHALPPGYVLKSQMKELLEEEARNTKDIAEQIEEERAKIEARTPITPEVFKAWRNRKVEELRKKREAEDEERRRKGIMSGKEMFLQEGFTMEDDAGASGADDLMREGQAEEEAAISAMLERAKEAAQRAKERAETEPSSIIRPVPEGEEDEEEDEDQEREKAGGSSSSSRPAQGEGAAVGPSSNGAAGGAATSHLKLDDQDTAALFEDDDDDDDDNGDLEEEELDELGQQIQSRAKLEDKQ